jgi:hypothetical protein
MIVDPIDQQPGREKGRRRRGRWRTPLKDMLLVAVTAILSSMVTYLYFAPMMIQLRHLEELRLIPKLHVEVAESLGENEGEMNFTIDVANLGPNAVDIFAVTRPMQEWIAFTERSSVKVIPALPFEANFGADKATVRLKEPLKAGSNASITFTAIKFNPTRSGHGANGMHTYLYADFHEQWIKFYSSMRPKPDPPPAASVPKPGPAPGRPGL